MWQFADLRFADQIFFVICGFAICSFEDQFLVLRLAIRQARVKISATEVFLSELTVDKEIERNLSEWRRMSVI